MFTIYSIAKVRIHLKRSTPHTTPRASNTHTMAQKIVVLQSAHKDAEDCRCQGLSQRKRRKQTDSEKKQRKETFDATKKKTQQEEKEDAERSRPANTFFLPRSTIRQRSNDNDGNISTGIGDSIRVDGVVNDGENHDGGEENDDDAQPDNVEQNEHEDEAVTIEIDSGSTKTRRKDPNPMELRGKS